MKQLMELLPLVIGLTAGIWLIWLVAREEDEEPQRHFHCRGCGRSVPSELHPGLLSVKDFQRLRDLTPDRIWCDHCNRPVDGVR